MGEQKIEKKEAPATTRKNVYQVKFLKPGTPWGFAYPAGEIATVQLDREDFVKLTEKGVITVIGN